ncbi:MAG: hypothetical protein WC373_11360 [Smithella sp.]|jgi:hypothetical protein
MINIKRSKICFADELETFHRKIKIIDMKDDLSYTNSRASRLLAKQNRLVQIASNAEIRECYETLDRKRSSFDRFF